MATIYISEDGHASANGTKEQPYSMAWFASNVASNNTYYFLGTITTSIDISGKISLVLVGNDPDYPAILNTTSNHGMYLHAGTRDCDVYGFTFRASASYAFYAAGTAGYNYLKVHDNVFDGSSTAGIKINYSGASADVNGCQVYDNVLSGGLNIIFANHAPGIRVFRNTISNVGTGGGTNLDAIGIDDGCDDAVVEDNVIIGHNDYEGAGVDVQNLGAGTTYVRRNKYINGIGKGLNHVGTEIAVFEANIVDGCKLGVFLYSSKAPASPTTSYYYNNTILNATQNLVKIGHATTEDQETTSTWVNNIIEGVPDGVDVFGVDVTTGSPTHTITTRYNCLGSTQEYGNFTPDATDIEEVSGVNGDYITTNSSLKAAGVWLAGVRAYDDLPLPLRPDIGAIQDRTAPGRRFGVGGGTL
jgi:hypothetical protein